MRAGGECSPISLRRGLAMVVVVPVVLLGACNTVQGVGRDVQAGGRAITGAGTAGSQAIGRATSPAPATTEAPAEAEGEPATQ